MSSMESLDKLQAELSGNVYADAFHTLYKLSQDVSVEHSELMAQAMKRVHKEKVEPLEVENAKLRELVRDMWQLINDLDATPYVTERHGNNPAVTWLDDDWSVHESCRERMRELGIEDS